MSEQGDDAGQRSARAKVALAVAQLRQFRERYDRAHELVVDRGEAIETAGREADYVIEALRAQPALYAERFASELAIAPDQARVILERFVGLAVAEIGDLRKQAIRDAERA